MKNPILRLLAISGRLRRHFIALCATSLITNYFSLNTSAQAPQGIPYQAIARNASGAAIANTAVKVRFSIRDSIATGAIKYQETHNPTTSALGLFSVNVGMGSVVSGTFSGINWGKNAKFLQVELDPAGGSSYTDLGTTQMMSVPYALYAGVSNSRNSLGLDTLIVYENPGTFSWTAPNGVSKVMIECWGGGGGGGSFGGAGGGGGGYAKGIYKVNPNSIYQIIVGSGGSGLIYSPYTPSSNGGRSSFGNLIYAEGGFSGENGGDGGYGFGQILIKGGNNSNNENQDILGQVNYIRRDGSSPNGGTSGTAPGGGGVSAFDSAPPSTGGNGASGRVIIYY